jgi:hypothetical protein
LIDEVESLTAARKAAMSGSEPSDAVRVVNALLTQIDALKQRSNVIILTTSNITEAIDLAFVDRADIKQVHFSPYLFLFAPVLLAQISRICLLSPSTSVYPTRKPATRFSARVSMS